MLLFLTFFSWKINYLEAAKLELFILDRDYTHSINVFSNSGKFLSKISHFGKDPESYDEIGDFFVDTIQNLINVLQTFPARIISYNYSGKFVKSKEVAPYGWQIAEKHHNYYIYMFGSVTSENIFHDLVIYDNHGKVLNKFFPINVNNPTNTLEMHSNFQIFDDSVSFVRPFIDTIYDITSGRVRAKYVIDFGNNNLPFGYFDKYSTENFIKALNKLDKTNYAYEVSPVLETKYFVYFGYHFKTNFHVAIFNKKTNRFLSKGKLINNFNGLPAFNPNNVIYAKKKSIYYTISAYDLKHYLRKLYEKSDKVTWTNFVKHNKRLIKIASHLKNTDNSILIKYFVKL